ncbi:MAG: amidohydrolase [Candidatus Diapherotrites archaeon]|nr:amidohydrolase [Candidatus Diapherotrites archaeon]
MGILIKNVLLDNETKDIFIKGNSIEKIGSSIEKNADIAIDGSGKAAIPSLINAHTHSAMNLLRSFADDMVLDEWLNKKIWPVEAKLSREDIYWGAKFACLEMIKSGTTCFNDMYFSMDAVAQAVKESGMRAFLGHAMLDFSDESKRKKEIDAAQKFVDYAKKLNNSRIVPVLTPHSIYTVSREGLVWIKDCAEKNNLAVHIHLSETEKEVNDCVKKTGKRPVEYLESIEFFAPGLNVIAAHGIWLDNNEIKILKKHGVTIVYNPASNMKLGSGVLPFEKLKKAGLNVCLGTDSSASNNSLDMFEEMKFASLLQKSNAGNPVVLPAQECFDMATVNAARAFGLNCGKIKEGTLADLLLVDLNNTKLNPNYNLVSNLVYSATGDCVDTVICDGRVLMHGRKVKGEKEILRKVNEIFLKLKK